MEPLKFQEELLDAYRRGATIHFEQREVVDNGPDRGVLFREIPETRTAWGAWWEFNPAGREASLRSSEWNWRCLPRTRAIVLGLDIREYSRRTDEQQLFMTFALILAIKKARELLQSAGVLNEDDVLATDFTGDGINLVFPFLSDNEMNVPLPEEAEKFYKEKMPRLANQAFALVFAVNAMVANDNRRQAFVCKPSTDGKSDLPVFPVQIRYAMSYDDVLLANDFDNRLNCVGRAKVTCARILSSDHGNHFLVDERLVSELQRTVGGLDAIGGGVWKQRLHSTTLPDVPIKSGKFRFVDVFGHYSDEPLLMAASLPSTTPTRHHIGSHDVGNIDR